MYAVVNNLSEYNKLDLLSLQLVITKFTLPNKPKKQVSIVRLVDSENELRIVGYYDFTITIGKDIDGVMRFEDIDDFAQKFISKSFELPSVFSKIKNFSSSFVKRISTGGENCPEEIYNQRISICNSCPFLSENRECSLCGCPVDIKAKWASESCPASPSQWLKHSTAKKCGCGH